MKPSDLYVVCFIFETTARQELEIHIYSVCCFRKSGIHFSVVNQKLVQLSQIEFEASTLHSVELLEGNSVQ